MPAHIHCHLMALYAKDALETDKPWMLWEYEDEGNFYTCALNPAWNENKYYRRKPKTIRIGEYDVPEPLRVAPEVDTICYYPNLFSGKVESIRWKHDIFYLNAINVGIIHSTINDAQTHLDALLSFTNKDS